ncbi:activin receptor type-2A-like [Octopus sinensis]|uniref:receptor protein serine/threonine kinase n=1 Tax=Octopus sinensis TaxID=2607531 RepID=A0A6P7U8S1_9MOLL|nr:activin receptor type-2A-like [Octopus sinensis]
MCCCSEDCPVQWPLNTTKIINNTEIIKREYNSMKLFVIIFAFLSIFTIIGVYLNHKWNEPRRNTQDYKNILRKSRKLYLIKPKQLTNLKVLLCIFTLQFLLNENGILHGKFGNHDVAIKRYANSDLFHNELTIFGYLSISKDHRQHCVGCVGFTESPQLLLTEYHSQASLSWHIHNVANWVLFVEKFKSWKPTLVDSMCRNFCGLYSFAFDSSQRHKPDNFLVSDDCKNVVLCDFEFAHCFKLPQESRLCHSKVGSPAYMAPELWEGNINYRLDSYILVDIYAFGCMIKEALEANTSWNYRQIIEQCRDDCLIHDVHFRLSSADIIAKIFIGLCGE